MPAQPRNRSVRLFAVVLLSLPVAGCGLFGSDAEPEVAARTFLSAFAAGDTTTASRATDDPQAAKDLMDKVRAALRPVALKTTVGTATAKGDTATLSYNAEWDLGRNRIWGYKGNLELRRGDKQWQVHWSPESIHPKLSAQQSLVLREQQPDPAPILDRDGGSLLAAEKVVSVLLDRKQAGNLADVAGALANALNRFDSAITQQSIVDRATKTPDGQAYSVALLRDPDYQKVKPQIYDLPGVRFSSQTRLLAPDRAFASQVLPGIRKAVEDQIEGKAGYRIFSVNAGGSEVETLVDEKAVPAQAVTATLSRAVQSAAEDAVEPVGNAAMVVAIQPSTGDVLAVAQNGAADAQGALALTGRYPPGSTFKIVTAAAALGGGAADANTELPCPGTWTIQGRRIPNDNEFELGTVPLHRAFARSCNTTFAELATKLPADALTRTAKQFGLGVDFVIRGMTTVTGSVPPASAVVERAEDGFGQGKVLASPFGMAMVAASVAKGSMPLPNLIRGVKTSVDAEQQPVAQPVLDSVRTMMREVVTEGTATKLQRNGEVRGKTGTAQFGDGTHSHGWFVGYRDDVAFAVLIVDAGSSAPAVDVASRFLAATP
ncbi:penicillin-binding transpeptidase domain-containing protein [Allokutzneria oryzae]|uniref:Penicillin-binding transpeptidase domain-containing protein n=1 Tax=Allokutzneria oryzae TaxID=1378989 RepID=A0ABV6A4N0_9PSEU